MRRIFLFIPVFFFFISPVHGDWTNSRVAIVTTITRPINKTNFSTDLLKASVYKNGQYVNWIERSKFFKIPGISIRDFRGISKTQAHQIGIELKTGKVLIVTITNLSNAYDLYFMGLDIKSDNIEISNKIGISSIRPIDDSIMNSIPGYMSRLTTISNPISQAFYFTTNSNNSITITAYRGPDNDVIIPAMINGMKVTAIGDSAFENLPNITSVVVPSSVTAIGEHAFQNCNQLTNINLPDSVNYIGSYCFDDSRALSSIVISGPLAGINEYTFWGCDKLTNVILPATITYINGGAFWYCEKLKTIDIPASVKVIHSRAFYECNSFTKISIPKSVTNIKADAFGLCKNLRTVTIYNKFCHIEKRRFYR